ncbi:unnamed protein product, partial [Allacma fusca]
MKFSPHLTLIPPLFLLTLMQVSTEPVSSEFNFANITENLHLVLSSFPKYIHPSSINLIYESSKSHYQVDALSAVILLLENTAVILATSRAIWSRKILNVYRLTFGSPSTTIFIYETELWPERFFKSVYNKDAEPLNSDRSIDHYVFIPLRCKLKPVASSLKCAAGPKFRYGLEIQNNKQSVSHFCFYCPCKNQDPWVKVTFEETNIPADSVGNYNGAPLLAINGEQRAETLEWRVVNRLNSPASTGRKSEKSIVQLTHAPETYMLKYLGEHLNFTVQSYWPKIALKKIV